MRYTLATLALAASAFANPAPQGVTSAISPSSTDPAGCSSSYSGSFEIETVNVSTSSKRDLEKRATVVTLKLANGILTDQAGRTGYIAKNSQFQFDSPPQTGAIYTAGWSVCANGTLAIGATTIFQQCNSGDINNLYLENSAAQCSAVYIEIIPVSGSSASTAAATQLSDGQVQATSAAVTQLSDGQIQATTAATAVTQISDGQIQAPSAHPITQISDGQIQAPTYTNPVTQISDGQIQAPTATTAKTTSKTTVAPVSQISDGQIQAPSAASQTASTTRSAVAYTGAAVIPTAGAEIFGLAAGVLAVALL